MALALEAAEQAVGDAADQALLVVRVAGLRLLARLGFEELLQVERLAGAQRHLAVVHGELRDRAHLARPLARAEEQVDRAALRLVGVA